MVLYFPASTDKKKLVMEVYSQKKEVIKLLVARSLDISSV